MADFTTLDAAIADLTDQVAVTETTEAGATTLINGFAASVTEAVTAALVADNAADDASVAKAQEAIATVKARFLASSTTLADAITANTPAA